MQKNNTRISYRALGDAFELQMSPCGDHYILLHISCDGRYSIVADLTEDGTDTEAAMAAARAVIAGLPVQRGLPGVAAAIAEAARGEAGLKSMADLMLELLDRQPSVFFEGGGPAPWQTDELRREIRTQWADRAVCRETGTCVGTGEAAVADAAGGPYYVSLSVFGAFEGAVTAEAAGRDGGYRATLCSDPTSAYGLYRHVRASSGCRDLTDGDGREFEEGCRLLGLDARRNAVRTVHCAVDGTPFWWSLADEWEEDCAQAVGHAVRRMRTEKGMSQADLAMRAHMRRATVCDIEAGRGDVRLSTLRAIATALGVRPADLLE